VEQCGHDPHQFGALAEDRIVLGGKDPRLAQEAKMEGCVLEFA
jgi:hypothetical protein